MENGKWKIAKMRNVAQTVGDGAYDVPSMQNAKCRTWHKSVGDGALDVPPLCAK